MFTFAKSAALLLVATAISVNAATNSSADLNPNAVDCFITVPANPLTIKGLTTPYLLQPPCSMAVTAQQAFVEAAVFDPATGGLSIYHPLVTNAGEKPAADPVIPKLPNGAIVGLWFGFNGGTLQLLNAEGQDVNSSPELKAAECVNGLSGVEGDVFGQISWCNAEQWFAAVNKGIKEGSVKIPDLGLDKNGNACPTSRSFAIADADPSDSVPTQYILIGNSTAQDTDANRKTFNPVKDIFDNASDEALLTNIVDPLIGCTPFQAASLDNPGALVSGLALSELQAALQPSPVAFVPLNDPDTLTTKDGKISVDKTNIYRAGVNPPPVRNSETSGDLQTYCYRLVANTPPFLKGFEKTFLGAGTPDTDIGNNLLTFLAGRYLSALNNLKCPAPSFQPVVCRKDGNGVATSCDINLASNGTVSSITSATSPKATKSSATKETDSRSQGAKGNGNIKEITTTEDAASKGTATEHGHRTINTAAASAVTTNGVTNIVLVVEIEVISFFIFIDNLGGHLPPAVLRSDPAIGSFIVIEEVFIELIPAASRACNHQSSSCSSAAVLTGATFSLADCQAQESNCLDIAGTASVTASAPPTVTATATTTVATATAATTHATNEATSQTASIGVGESAISAVQGAAISSSTVASNNQCGSPTITVIATSSATTLHTKTSGVATSHRTSGVAAPSASAGLPSRHHRARHRRALGKY